MLKRVVHIITIGLLRVKEHVQSRRPRPEEEET
jgi:hypothetical protein